MTTEAKVAAWELAAELRRFRAEMQREPSEHELRLIAGALGALAPTEAMPEIAADPALDLVAGIPDDLKGDNLIIVIRAPDGTAYRDADGKIQRVGLKSAITRGQFHIALILAMQGAAQRDRLPWPPILKMPYPAALVRTRRPFDARPISSMTLDERIFDSWLRLSAGKRVKQGWSAGEAIDGLMDLGYVIRGEFAHNIHRLADEMTRLSRKTNHPVKTWTQLLACAARLGWYPRD